MATFNLSKDLNNSEEQLDVLIDFSLPDSTEISIKLCGKKNGFPWLLEQRGLNFCGRKIEKSFRTQLYSFRRI